MTVTPCGENLAVELSASTEYVNTAMTPGGQDTSDRIIVCIDTGASSKMVAEDSALAHKEMHQKACCVRVKGSCGTSTAKVNGALDSGSGIINKSSSFLDLELTWFRSGHCLRKALSWIYQLHLLFYATTT